MTTHTKLLVFCMPIPVDVVSAVTDVLQPIVQQMELRYDTLTGGTALWGVPLEEVPAGRPFTHLLVENPEPVDSTLDPATVHNTPGFPVAPVGRAKQECEECDFETDWPAALIQHRRTHQTRSDPAAPSVFDDAGEGVTGPEQKESGTSTRQVPVPGGGVLQIPDTLIDPAARAAADELLDMIEDNVDVPMQRSVLCPVCGTMRPTVLQLAAHVDHDHEQYVLQMDAGVELEHGGERWRVILRCELCDLMWEAADDNHRALFDQHVEEIHIPTIEEAEHFDALTEQVEGPDVELELVVQEDEDTSDSVAPPLLETLTEELEVSIQHAREVAAERASAVDELEEPAIVDCSECGRPYSRERLARHLRIDHRWDAEVAEEEARGA